MDTSALIRAVRAVAAEKSTVVYTKDKDGDDCVYREKTGEPSCLIGHAMSQIGQLDLITSDDRNTDDIRHLMLSLQVNFTSTQIEWLEKVQKKQDRGLAWGEAVSMADYEIGSIE